MELRIFVFNLLYAMFFAGIVTFIAVVIADGIIAPFKRSKALREARDAGHEVVAKRTDFKFENGTEGRNYTWGYFEYEYKGKKYRYKKRFLSMPPEEIVLYFKNKPQKAKPEYSFGGVESGYGTVFCIATIIFFLLRLV